MSAPSGLVVRGVSRSLSVEAAARLVGVSPSTVRRALVRGDLEGYRAGQRAQFRIPEAAIGEWIRPAADTEATRP